MTFINEHCNFVNYLWRRWW